MFDIWKCRENDIISKYTYDRILKLLESYTITITKIESDYIEIRTYGKIKCMKNEKSFEEKVLEFIGYQMKFNAKQEAFNTKIEDEISELKNKITVIEEDIKEIKMCPTIIKEINSIK